MGCDMLLKQMLEDVPAKAVIIINYIKLLKDSLNEMQEAFWDHVDQYRKSKNFDKLRYYIGINEQIEEYIKTINNLLDIYENSNVAREAKNAETVDEIAAMEKDALIVDEDDKNDKDVEPAGIEEVKNIAKSEAVKELNDSFPIVQKISPEKPIKDLNLISPKKQPDLMVNEVESHSLYESFLHKKPCAFKIEEKIIKADTWQKMLVKTCEYLFKKDEKLFMSLEFKEHMNGTSKKYFSTKPEEMTKRAKLIGGKMYIELNQGANLIRNLIKKLLKEYGLSVVDYRVYFSDVSHLIQAE